MGIKTFNHSRLQYEYDSNGNVVEKKYTLKEKLDNEYKTYLKSL